MDTRPFFSNRLFIFVLRLAFCTHRVVQEVLVGQAQTVFQFRLVSPAQIGSLRHIQQLAGSTVRLGGIPLDLAGVAHDLGDQLGQLLNGQFLAGTALTVSLPE